MPQDEYQKMVMGNEILLEIDNKLTEKIEKVRENIHIMMMGMKRVIGVNMKVCCFQLRSNMILKGGKQK